MIAQGCEATLWSSAQVRRFLENEGYKDLWAFLEPDAPISGHDLLSNYYIYFFQLYVSREIKVGKKSVTCTRIFLVKSKL